MSTLIVWDLFSNLGQLKAADKAVQKSWLFSILFDVQQIHSADLGKGLGWVWRVSQCSTSGTVWTCYE